MDPAGRVFGYRLVAAAVSGKRLRTRARRVEGAPVVAVRAWLRGGSREELTPGQALISGRLLSEGTAQRSWRDIAGAAEARGASVAAFGDLELRGLAIDALAADWELAVEWAAELVLESSFPEDRCVWARRQAEGELASLADHPDSSTSWAFLDQLYRPHAAGRPPHGDVESLGRLGPDHCREFHLRALEAGLVVSVAGLIDPEAARERVRQVFARTEGEARGHQPSPQPVGGEPRQNWPVKGDQAHVFLGKLTVPRGHEALPALRLLAVILGAGGGLSGRIPNRVREQEGLAYVTHVDTAAGAGLDRGRFVTYVGTAVETVDRTIEVVREELERLRDGGVTDAEVEEARAYLLGREPFRRETARQWADLMAAAVHYDLPIDDPEWVVDRLASVDREQIEQAARRFLDPEDLKITVGAP
jgi:zinc protease